MEDLIAWRREAEDRITAIGDSFEVLDGGPKASELMVGIPIRSAFHISLLL
jgi:hypothetical protein